MLYAYKAIHNNYKIYYNNKAMVYHSHNFSYIEQFKRNFAIAKSQKQNKESSPLCVSICWNPNKTAFPPKAYLSIPPPMQQKLSIPS